MHLIKFCYLLGQWGTGGCVQTQRCNKCDLRADCEDFISAIPLRFQTAADEERRTTSYFFFFLLITSSSSAAVLSGMGILEGEGNSKTASPCVAVCASSGWDAYRRSSEHCVDFNYCSQNNSNTALTHHPLELSTNHSPPLWLSLAEFCSLLKMNFLFCCNSLIHSSI